MDRSALKIGWGGSYLGDRVLALLATAIAVLYTKLAAEGFSAASLTQAILSWCFIPFVWFWRSRPLLSSTGFLVLLAAWAGSWTLALPANLGISPLLATAPMAVYTTAKFSNNRRVPRIVLGITLAGSLFSPAMWFLGSDLELHYRMGLHFLVILALHWLLLAAAYLAGSRAFGKVLQSQSEKDAALMNLRRVQEEERLLIARELHDALAHSLTLMKVQANAGIISAAKDSQAALRTLEEIRDTSDSALTSVREIVRALRSKSPTDVKPTLLAGNIPDLLEGFQMAGLRIDSRLPEEAPELSPLTELAITRILSESLTNALRHQGTGTRVRIRLQYSSTADLTVTSESSQKHSPRHGARVGLIGMQERAQSLGGTFSARGTQEFFEVHASIPLRSAQ